MAYNLTDKGARGEMRQAVLAYGHRGGLPPSSNFGATGQPHGQMLPLQGPEDQRPLASVSLC